jgi:membrane complex biogenesis BtpA family protein
MNIIHFKEVFGSEKPVFGMVHLPPLPGSPNYGNSMEDVINHALFDSQVLVENGVTALIVENLGDYPYYPVTQEPETVAAMTRVALEIKKKYPDTLLGINVLRNSWKSAIAIAYLVGAQFIRLNVLTDVMATDQGLIVGEAHLALRYRKYLGADNVLLFCDLYSKHAAPLAARDLRTVASEMVGRGMADAIIISGPETPVPPLKEDILQVRQAVPDVPIILGSGITTEVCDIVSLADGVVFGYGSKPSGNMNDPVDEKTVRIFMERISNI